MNIWIPQITIIMIIKEFSSKKYDLFLIVSVRNTDTIKNILKKVLTFIIYRSIIIKLSGQQIVFLIFRGMEQMVARRAHNPKVVGSNPAPATI